MWSYMTVKVFKCEIICKRNNAWRIGREAIVKALHGGEFRGSIPTDSINFLCFTKKKSKYLVNFNLT
jgi:hypothetical protein